MKIVNEQTKRRKVFILGGARVKTCARLNKCKPFRWQVELETAEKFVVISRPPFHRDVFGTTQTRGIVLIGAYQKTYVQSEASGLRLELQREFRDIADTTPVAILEVDYRDAGLPLKSIDLKNLERQGDFLVTKYKVGQFRAKVHRDGRVTCPPYSSKRIETLVNPPPSFVEYFK